MSKTSYKAVLRSRYSTDTTGTIKIRKLENQKQTLIPLDKEYKILKRYWNSKSGTVRKNPAINADEINQEIKDKIRELEESDKIPDYHTSLTNNKDSFISYFEGWLGNRVSNVGSEIKYQSVLNKLKKYLKSIGKEDLKFKDVTTNQTYNIKKHFQSSISINTCTHYMKLIKQVLDEAIEENKINYIRHPFLGFDFNTTKVEKKALSTKEIDMIIDKDIPETNKLFYTRNCFLAQLFLQGMRASDLQLIRYSNIKNNTIEYQMFKTGKEMRVPISDIAWDIIIYQFKKGIKSTFISKLEKELEELKVEAVQYFKNMGITSGFETLINTYCNYAKDGEVHHEVFKKINVKQETLFINYKNLISEFGKQDKKAFIFDFHKKEDFPAVTDNKFHGKVKKDEYKRIKHKTMVYNRHLKKLQELVGLEINLTTHLSRSSFASLLLATEGVDVYNISTALGHSGLAITEKYLVGFDDNKTAEINNTLSDSFRR